MDSEVKKKYIGRIKLSKEDSIEWEGNPEYMYVTKGGNRADINCAHLFPSLGQCRRELSKSFVEHKHNKYGSIMEVLEVNVTIKKIAEVYGCKET